MDRQVAAHELRCRERGRDVALRRVVRDRAVHRDDLQGCREIAAEIHVDHVMYAASAGVLTDARGGVFAAIVHDHNEQLHQAAPRASGRRNGA